MKKDHSLIIKLRKVWKTYKMGKVEVNALRGVDLEIKKGEFVAVIGPSGSGKSTMMSLIGCLDIPTKGKIYLDRLDISKLNESTLAQIRGKKIGFVFQFFNLIPTLTALENVMLPMEFQEVSVMEMKKRAKELLNLVGLGDRIYHRPAELSGGEMQRVAIARSLANNPEMILADEPTGNLDSKTGIVIIDLIGKLHKEQGKTVVMVTHDEHVAEHAQRIVFLKDGQIAETRREMTEAELKVKAKLHSPKLHKRQKK